MEKYDGRELLRAVPISGAEFYRSIEYSKSLLVAGRLSVKHRHSHETKTESWNEWSILA
jgi:hypothetical protein